MTISIIVIAEDEKGKNASFIKVIYVTRSGPLDFDDTSGPEPKDIEKKITDTLNTMTQEINNIGMRVTSHSHCVFK